MTLNCVPSGKAILDDLFLFVCGPVATLETYLTWTRLELMRAMRAYDNHRDELAMLSGRKIQRAYVWSDPVNVEDLELRDLAMKLRGQRG